KRECAAPLRIFGKDRSSFYAKNRYLSIKQGVCPHAGSDPPYGACHAMGPDPMRGLTPDHGFPGRPMPWRFSADVGDVGVELFRLDLPQKMPEFPPVLVENHGKRQAAILIAQIAHQLDAAMT